MKSLLTSLILFLLKFISINSSYAPIWEEFEDPVIFRTPLLHHWEAHNWTKNKLSELILTNLTNVYKSNNNYFPYFDMSDNRYKNYNIYESVSMNITDFFNISDNHSSYVYYSSNVMHPSLSNITDHIKPQLLVNESLTATLWMGSVGVQSTTHYDDSYNLYIQLIGKKRFRLLPHSFSDALCIHGRFHIHSRQSRYLDIHSGTMINTTWIDDYNLEHDYSIMSRRSNNCPNLNNTSNITSFSSQIREIILSPGDILYMPHFYFHEVSEVK
jgi:hypothetical protein